MVKKMKKYAKFVVCMALISGLMAPSYAALSASDGSAFVTKAEFDSALADFNARLTTFEAGINSKIDSQVTSYLDRNGIWSGKDQVIITKEWTWSLKHPQINSSVQNLVYEPKKIAEMNKSGMCVLWYDYCCMYNGSGHKYAQTWGDNMNLTVQGTTTNVAESTQTWWVGKESSPYDLSIDVMGGSPNISTNSRDDVPVCKPGWQLFPSDQSIKKCVMFFVDKSVTYVVSLTHVWVLDPNFCNTSGVTSYNGNLRVRISSLLVY